MTRAQLFVANNIPENSKTAIRQKSIKTNLENRQLLMMTLLQHQKLISAFFVKTILLSSSQKKKYNHADDSAEANEFFEINFGFTIPKHNTKVVLGLQRGHLRIF